MRYYARETALDGHRIVQLEDTETDTRVSISPEFGNNAFEFRHRGHNYLWQPTDGFQAFYGKRALFGVPFSFSLGQSARSGLILGQRCPIQRESKARQHTRRSKSQADSRAYDLSILANRSAQRGYKRRLFALQLPVQRKTAPDGTVSICSPDRDDSPAARRSSAYPGKARERVRRTFAGGRWIPSVLHIAWLS